MSIYLQGYFFTNIKHHVLIQQVQPQHTTNSSSHSNITGTSFAVSLHYGAAT